MSSNQATKNINNAIKYWCNCGAVFYTPFEIINHAVKYHQQTVLSFAVNFIGNSEIYRIVQIEPPLPPPTAPITYKQPFHFDFDAQDSSQVFQQEVPAALEDPIHNGSHAIQQENPQMHEEPPLPAQHLIPEPTLQLPVTTPKCATKLNQPQKVYKRRGRKPKNGILSSKAQNPSDRPNIWVSWFNGAFSKNFNLPTIDFRDCTDDRKGSRLSKLMCRYIASWGIKEQSYFTPIIFREIRDRLIVLNTLLQCEVFYIRWRGISQIPLGNFVYFFNYFVVEFLPWLILEKDTVKWMESIESNVLTRKKDVFKIVSKFLLWWRRNDHSNPGIFRNPKFNFLEVITAEEEFTSPEVNVKEEESEKMKMEKKEMVPMAEEKKLAEGK